MISGDFAYRRSSKPSRTRRSNLATVTLQEDTVISQKANRREKKNFFNYYYNLQDCREHQGHRWDQQVHFHPGKEQVGQNRENKNQMT